MKLKKIWPATLLAVLAILLAACGSGEATPVASQDVNMAEETQTVPVGDAGNYTDVSVDGLAVMMEEKSFPLVNVHIPYEGE
ncbi:MAG: hypothetical protein ACOC9Z_08050, partial [Chloroflexota bacterium]